MYINMTEGDFIFNEWDDENSWKSFNKKEHELRLNRFRKVEQWYDYQNFYVIYKKGKRRIMLTMQCM